MGRKGRIAGRNSGGRRALPLLLLAVCIVVAAPLPAYGQANSPPAFPAAASIRSIAENLPPFRPVGVPLAATDPDAAGTLTYSLSGEDAEFFRIGATTGQLETTASLDYETRSSYSVLVDAIDPGGLFATVSVNINVTNVDEAGEITFWHKTLAAGAEAEAVLTDPDGNLSEVSWQWAASNDEATWEDIPGADSAAYFPGPEDFRRFLQVQVIYTDGHGPGKAVAAPFNPGTLLPGNDYANNNPPEFPFSESGVRSAGADAPAGQAIGQPILAGDLDRDLLTYRISGDAAQLFDIDLYSGQLTAGMSLAGQPAGQYFGVVHVFDGKGGSASKLVRIDVGNVPIPAIVPPAPLPAAAEEAAPAPLTQEPEVASELPQPLQAPALAATSEETSPAAPVAVPASQPVLAQAAGGSPSSTPAPTSQATPGPTAAAEPAAESDAGPGDEPAVALAAVNQPPLASPSGVATAGPVAPSGGEGPAAAGESGAFGALLAWAVGAVLGALVLAGATLLLLRARRGKEKEITLPPPTVGPERRIGPLPVFTSERDRDAVSQGGDD